jgi:pSer/pThr/pTyr-binding forkhead associated (FHA) protein
VQRAILELRWGPEAGTKAVLEPGQSLRVGRKQGAEWLVEDKHLSGAHFEVAWDGARFTVRDLDSAAGTLIGGEKLAKGELQNGGWIRAGETDFMVYFEEATPPPIDEDAWLFEAEEDELSPLQARWVAENREPIQKAAAARAARCETALRALSALPLPLFAVLDAARTPRILTVLRESVERYRSLYEGIDGESLEHVAPYLVQLEPGSPLLARLVREGWEGRWGIFLESSRSFKELRRHLRRFLMVADGDTRQRYYFRFYDPAVMRRFLPTTTVKQNDELFGEHVHAFDMEGEEGEPARFTREVA